MKRILVAEDDANIRETLADLLVGEGYSVETAADGEAAIAKWRGAAEPFDLIMLDVMMPGKSGYDVCREIRASGSRVAVLMLSAKGEEIDKVIGLELGADDYVTKPFGVRELLARVAAAIRRAGGVGCRFASGRRGGGGFPLLRRKREYTALRTGRRRRIRRRD